MRRYVGNVYTSHSAPLLSSQLVPSHRNMYMYIFSQMFSLIVIFQNNVDYNKKNYKHDSNLVPSS